MMTRFILLHDKSGGNSIQVNPHHIAMMCREVRGEQSEFACTCISLSSGQTFIAKEDIPTIKEKIEALDYSRCMVEYVAMKGVSPLKLDNAAVAKDGRLHRESDAKPWVSLNRTMFGAEVAIRSSGDAERDSDISSRCHEFMRRVAP